MIPSFLLLAALTSSAHASKVLMFALLDQPTRPPTRADAPFCEGPLNRDAFMNLSTLDSVGRYKDSRALLDLFTGLVLPEGANNPTFTITQLPPKMKIKTPTGPVLVSDARAGDEIYAYDLARLSVVITRIQRIHRVDEENFELTIDQ